MKRLFPRAVPEAVGLLGLVLIVSGGCAPDNSVKPGAPVLTMLSIVDPSGSRVDITSETLACATGVKEGASCDPTADMLCFTKDSDWCNCVATPEPPAPETPPCSTDTPDAAGSDGPAAGGADGGVDAASDATLDATGDAAAMTDATLEAGTDASTDAAAGETTSDDAGTARSDAADAAAASDAAAAEVATPKGTWGCPAFSPMSKVIATFDRLLDTVPLTPADDKMVGRDDLADATVKTTVTPAPTTLTDYTPNGSTGGLIFKLFGENPGPNLSIVAQPGWPASNTITVSLSKSRVLAKDHKTPFTSSGIIKDGVVTFKTGGFSASVAVPPNAFPPPDMDAGTDGAADAAADAASTAASTDAAAAADACVPPPPPPPMPTTALADMTPVTITFNDPIDATTIASHVHVTADGAAYDDQVDVATDPKMSPVTAVTVTPKTTWKPSTTFVVTVDDKVVDVFMDKVSGAADGTFTTGAK